MRIDIAKDIVKIAIDHRGRRSELLRGYVFDAVGRFTPELAVETEIGRFFVSTSDKEIGRTLFARGAYADLETLRVVLEHLYGSSREGDQLQGRTFLDIGANIGTTTIAAVRLFGAASAWAVEPFPDNFRLLQQNLLANGIADRVVAVPAAVSDHEGVIELELSSWNSGDHRVLSDADSIHTSAATVSVESATLDSLVARLDIDVRDVGLVWIDTQGHEANVLACAETLIAQGVPIVAEYWPHGLGPIRLAQLEETIRTRFRAWADLGRTLGVDRLVERRPSEIGSLRDTYSGLAFTDLLLLS